MLDFEPIMTTPGYNLYRSNMAQSIFTELKKQEIYSKFYCVRGRMGKSEINFINSMDVDINDATPMLKQFLDIKKNNLDVLLLYRMGDFYETFFEDALVLSKDCRSEEHTSELQSPD